MKKEHKFCANKTTSYLDLYTTLTGIFFSSLGINFLLVFIYCKLMLEYEYIGLILILGILMLLLTPITMIDPKKENRNLLAVISYGLVHSICTIVSILLTHFWLLSVAYIIELSIVILLAIKTQRKKKLKHR